MARESELVGPGSDTTAIHVDVAGEIAGIATKATPVSADLLVIEDSAAANAKKSITIGDLPFSTLGFTEGSVPFVGPTGNLLEDNSEFFWDNATKMLGLGHAPGAKLDVLVSSGRVANFVVSGSNTGFVEFRKSSGTDLIGRLEWVGTTNSMRLITTALGDLTLGAGNTSLIILDSGGTVSNLNVLLDGGAAFAADTDTATLGIRATYACTSTAAARTLTISTADIAKGSVANPWRFIVNDESGGAAANNITVDTQGAETIDGAASQAITANYGVLRLYSNGINLFSW